MWDESRSWEEASCNNHELWDCNYDSEKLARARELWQCDRQSALDLLSDLSARGLAPISHFIGEVYEYGWGIEKNWNQARDFYVSAVSQGSWMATLDYARLLNKGGFVLESEQVLNDGIEENWVPSYFWLTWYRHGRSANRQTYRDIKSYLIHAAEAGHPMAQALRVRFTLFGKFGLREIPHGFKLAREQFVRLDLNTHN